MYCIIPAGVSTSTISSLCAPIRAFPTGDSLEIFPSRLFASVEPTIWNSISSSYSRSSTSTLHPILILSESTSSSTTTSAFFRIFRSLQFLPRYHAAHLLLHRTRRSRKGLLLSCFFDFTGNLSTFVYFEVMKLVLQFFQAGIGKNRFFCSILYTLSIVSVSSHI